MVLIGGLPFDKSLFLSPYYSAFLDSEDEESSTPTKNIRNTKQEYDRKANRTGRMRSRISLDDFIAQSDGLGNKTTLKDISNKE